MGRHKSNKSLIHQVKNALDSKLAIGESKYLAKLDGTYTNRIYSWETYRSYLKHCCYFVRWCKDQPVDSTLGHKPHTLAECRIFAERWLQYNIDRGLSAYTIKLQASALAKLYGCSTKDFNIRTPPRKRANITRSRRDDVAMDKHFSAENNKDLITFCRCTGLRRAELGDTYFDIVVTEAIDNSLNDIPFRGSQCAFTVTEKVTTKSCTIRSTSSISTSVGKEFELNYRFSTYQIASGSMAIQYDPELFEVVSVTNGDFLTGKIADVNTDLDGAINLSFVGTKTQYNYDIITVRFKTLKNVADSSNIKLTVSELCDIDLNPYSCSGYTTKANIVFDETYTEDAPSMSVSAAYSQDTGKATATITLEKDSMLGAGDFVLNFDPEVLTYVSAQKGFSPDYFVINEGKADEGILKFYIVSTEDITAEQIVLTVIFDVKVRDEAFSTDIFINGSVLTDALGKSIVLNFVDGNVTISKKQTAAISGTVTSFGSNTDDITIELIPEGQTVAAYTTIVRGNNATYSISNVAEGTYTIKAIKGNHVVYEEILMVAGENVTKDITLVAVGYLIGDVNGDFVVDNDDAIYLLRHTLMEDKYPINQDGDMNRDGVVDNDDAIYLLRHTLMPDKYPLG